MRYDVIVIGSNEAGCAAALEGARRGLEVLLIDDGALDQDYLTRRRAFPMHCLREPIVRHMALCRALNMRVGDLRLEPKALRMLEGRARKLGQSHATAISRKLASMGVVTIFGGARLDHDRRVRLATTEACDADIIVIACRSSPRRPKRFLFDARVVCDEWSVVQFDRMPRNLLVIGAEAVGCEVACVFAALGSEVTLLDRRSRMLRYADRDISEILHRSMRELGVAVVIGETLENLEVNAGCAEPHAVAKLGSGRIEKFDRVFVSAGQSPELDALGLERANVERDAGGFIVTDDRYSTSRGGVYAVGDAVAGASLSGASEDGRAAIRSALDALGEGEGMEEIITINTIPEIAMLGLTQEMCERLEIPHTVGLGRYQDLTSGQIRGDVGGIVKLVVDRVEQRLLGVHVIGEGARELVQVGAVALRKGESVYTLANARFSQPSLMEAYGVAAADCVDRLEAECSGLQSDIGQVSHGE